MKKLIKTLVFLVFIGLLALAAVVGPQFFSSIKTIGDLMNENAELKNAITNLTTEGQIGYAKVVSQQQIDGQLFTTIRFKETSPDDPLEVIYQVEYTLTGDVIHFDALIVKFDNQLVMDGKEHSMYLWRRVYSDKMAPESGMAIDNPGVEPARYKEIFAGLDLQDREIFWKSIWELAETPKKLRQYGIEAVYGNAIYTKLKPGLIYVFKITPSGQIFPQIVPEM